MAQVLVIEDECDVAEVIEYNLRNSGYFVCVVGTAEAGLLKVRELKPDLVLLDLMLPDRSGTEVCRIMKQDRNLRHIPIIMVTAKSEEIDRVVGFELGAEDYVTKPFSIRELLLRVKRTLQHKEDNVAVGRRSVEHGLLRIDGDAHRIWAAGIEVELTALEFRLLQALAEKSGRVLSREEVLAIVWGHGTTVCLRTVDAHVKRLRSRLGAAGICVETVRGVGYRYASVDV